MESGHKQNCRHFTIKKVNVSCLVPTKMTTEHFVRQVTRRPCSNFVVKISEIVANFRSILNMEIGGAKIPTKCSCEKVFVPSLFIYQSNLKLRQVREKIFLFSEE